MSKIHGRPGVKFSPLELATTGENRRPGSKHIEVDESRNEGETEAWSCRTVCHQQCSITLSCVWKRGLRCTAVHCLDKSVLPVSAIGRRYSCCVQTRFCSHYVQWNITRTKDGSDATCIHRHICYIYLYQHVFTH